MRKKRKKKSLLSICCLLLFLFANTFITNATVFTNSGDLYGGYFKGWLTAYKYDDSGNVAYCLQHNLKSPDGITYSQYSQMQDKYFRVLKNGYPQKSFTGYNEIDYYITQMAVWCLTEGWYSVNDLQWVYNSNYYPNATESNVKWYINKLINIGYYGAENSGINLKFNNSNVKAQLGQDGYFYTELLNISSGSSETSVVNGTGNLALKLNGDSEGVVIQDVLGRTIKSVAVGQAFMLKIPSTKSSGNITISCMGTIMKKVALEWNEPIYSGTYQKVVSLNDDIVYETSKTNATVTWDSGTSYFQIVKEDETTHERLKGAVFKIDSERNDADYGTLTTGDDGTATSGNCRNGIYYVQEVTAPEGYVLDNTIHEINIENSGQIHYIKLYNKKIKGSVELIKKDNEKGKSLSGAVFELYKEDNTLVGQYTTDDDGKIIVNDLEYGNYYFKEIEAPGGYILDKSKHSFSINKNGIRINLIVNNVIKKGDVELIKIDSETKEKIKGAIFELYKQDNTLLGQYTTSTEGNIIITNLEYGNYYFKEKQAPEGYLLDESKYSFSITENKQIVNLEAENQIKKGSVLLVKIDSETKAKLKDTIFELYGVDDKLLGEFKTDDEGQIKINDLKYGNYYLKEKAAAEGYLLNENKYLFSITENKQIVSLEAENNIKKGSVILLKIDSETRIKLKNTVFELYSSEDKFLGEYTTNDEGQIKIDELRYGDYYLKEKAAPEGYLLDESKYSFSITENKQIVNLEAENQIKKGSVLLVKIDSETRIKLKNTVFELYSSEDKFLGEYTTNDKGQIKIDELRYGDYYLKEKAAAEGYLLNENKYPFSITENKQIVSLEAENNIKKGSVILLKIDSETRIKLKNTVFELYSSEDKFLGEYTTNDEGQIKIDELRYGDYYLKEKAAAEGYLLNENKYPFLITENKQIVSLEAENNRIKSKVKIYKLDNDTYKITEDEQVQEIIDTIKGENDKTSNYTSNEKKADTEDDKDTTNDNKISTITKDKINNLEGLEGVKFKLECLEGFHKGEVQEMTSLKDGLDLELEYGKYRLKEVQTIDGYILNTDPIEFTISQDGKEYLIQKGNDRIIGKIKVLKIDGKTNVALEGATFKLTCIDGFDKGKEIIFTSLPEGNEFDLQYGKYQLQEITAPPGYILYDKIIDFEVTENNQEFTFSVPNDPIKIEVKTNDKTNYILPLVNGSISGIIIAYMLWLKRKRDNNNLV